ncbi:hypothetical protein Tco_1249148 [Tanacetum coccineum]
MTAAIATTVIASVISASVSRVDVAGPSQPAGAETSTDTFLVSQDLDFETLQQIYVPKWNVINDSALDDPEVCRSMVDQLAPPRSKHNYTVRKKFERRCARLIGLLREKDVEVANLKAHLSLKEAEAAEAIRLRGQIATIEAMKAAWSSALDDLLNIQLSCDELNIKAASLETEKDKLIDQVSTLEGTCSGLCDKVMGYKLFKEQIEVVQDEQVKVLSDKVAGIDADLIRMALT